MLIVLNKTSPVPKITSLVPNKTSLVPNETLKVLLRQFLQIRRKLFPDRIKMAQAMKMAQVIKMAKAIKGTQ